MIYSLQSQVSILQEENNTLKQENRELNDLNHQAEQILKERIDIEHGQSKSLRDMQYDFVLMKGKYEQMSEAQRDLESLAADEQAMRMSAEARLHAAEQALEDMRHDNRQLKLTSDTATERLSQVDHQLANASEQLNTYAKEMASLSSTTDKAKAMEAINGVLKGDISRLIRLLEHYPAAKGFVSRWQESESLSFTGIGNDQSVEYVDERGVKQVKVSYKKSEKDKEWEDEAKWKEVGLNPNDLNKLKKTYNMDPFPLPSSFEDELTLWVPHESLQAGMTFLTAKVPHAPPNIIMDFVSKMNKIWIRRERRKLLELQDYYEKLMSELKRKANSAKPYRRVLAEKQMKRLKNALRDERSKSLNGKPKAKKVLLPKPLLEVDDFDESDAFGPGENAPHNRRPCATSPFRDERTKEGHSTGRRRANITSVSTEKLLEASLVSLETIGRQNSYGQQLGGTSLSGGLSANLSDTLAAGPSDEFLRGALWLGKNLVMVAEELSEAMTYYRAKHLGEVNAAASDTDLTRCCRRLSLLANAGMTEAVALTSSTKTRARELLEGAAALTPGDHKGLQDLLLKLPIDFAYSSASPARASNAYAQDSRQSTPRASPSRGKSRYNT